MVATSTHKFITPKKELDLPNKHWAKQKFLQKYAHYSFTDFCHFHLEQRVITDWHESRNLFASEDFIIGLIEDLVEEVGSASGVVMYNIGYQWGMRDAKFFQQWFEQE